MIYEVVALREAAEIEVGGVYLRQLICTEEREEEIWREADCWRVVEHVKYENTLYWHNDDVESGSRRVVHTGVPLVVKDGALYGFLVSFRNEDSFGMSYRSERRELILCLDGSVHGENRRHVSHSSSEVDKDEESTFVLEPAE